MLTADEVERSITASWRLLRREADSLDLFDLSVEGHWRSYAAVLLIAPAFLIHMAGQWHMLLAPGGLTPVSADLARFLSIQSAGLALNWIAWPAIAMLFVQLLGLERRYFAYVTAYNWSSVLTYAILATPMALYLMGWARPDHAFVFAIAFYSIVLHFRWFLARAVLGVTPGVAAILVAADVAVSAMIVQVTGFVALSG